MVAVAVAAVSVWPETAGAQDPSPLRFCAGEHNLPLSAAAPPRGVEVSFARALAGRLGRTAAFHWMGVEEDAGQAVLDGHCELALGAVVDDGSLADARLRSGLALSEPYYAAGYVLVRRADATPVRRLSELREVRVGVESESVAIFSLKLRGHHVHVLPDHAAVIRAIATGNVAYGYVWGPLAAWSLRARTDILIEDAFEVEERWGFALAIDSTDTALLGRVNREIRRMRNGGIIGEIFSEYGIPYLAPRARGGSAPAVEEPGHAPPDVALRP
jgi:ABC-type amino acid transport substrate-binding protein